MPLRPLLSIALFISVSGCGDRSSAQHERAGEMGGSGGSAGSNASGGSTDAGGSSGEGGLGGDGGSTDAGGSSGDGGAAGNPGVEMDCTPLSRSCDGLVPRTCDADGIWQSGEECERGCNNGECTQVCVPGDTPGYTSDAGTCTPIDFCSPPNGGCSPNAVCSQSGSVPTCTCAEGYTGDGLACSLTTPRISEGFDDTSLLAGAGWTLQNLSEPIGSSNWYQGNAAVFSAFNGADGAYLAADHFNVQDTNTISNWLVTPSFAFGSNATVSFYTRSVASEFPDRIEIRACLVEPCAMPTTPSEVGDYTTLLGSVNPTLAIGGYPSVWTEYTFTNADGIPYSGDGRIAIRYWVTEGGPLGDYSDYVGVDQLTVTTGEPAYTVGGTVTGLTESGLVLWLNGSVQLPVAVEGAFVFDRGLDAGTPYAVSVLAQPASQTCVVANGSGSISANVNDVSVSCASAP